MSPRDAFKAGFMLACGDMGLTGPQAKALVQKAAALMDKRALGLSDLGDAAKTTAIGLPIAAGAGLGYLAHRASGGGGVDPDDVKTKELIEELRKYTRRAREAQSQRSVRQSLGF